MTSWGLLLELTVPSKNVCLLLPAKSMLCWTGLKGNKPSAVSSPAQEDVSKLNIGWPSFSNICMILNDMLLSENTDKVKMEMEIQTSKCQSLFLNAPDFNLASWMAETETQKQSTFAESAAEVVLSAKRNNTGNSTVSKDHVELAAHPSPGTGNAFVLVGTSSSQWQPGRTATPPSAPSRRTPGRRNARRQRSQCRGPTEESSREGDERRVQEKKKKKSYGLSEASRWIILQD